MAAAASEGGNLLIASSPALSSIIVQHLQASSSLIRPSAALVPLLDHTLPIIHLLIPRNHRPDRCRRTDLVLLGDSYPHVTAAYVGCAFRRGIAQPTIVVATTGVSRHYAVRPPIRHPIYRTAKSARRPTKRAVQPVFPSLAAEGQGRGAARVRPQHLIQTDVSGRGTATRFAAVFNATPDGRAQDALSVLIPHASVALMIGEEPVFSSPSEPTLTEGFYLLLAVKLWKDDARHGDLILISDNQRAINLLSADQRNVPYTFAGEITPKLVRTLNVLRTIGREILDIAVIADINVRYQWVPRRENSLANSLARWDLVGHRVLFHPNMWAKMESTRKRLAEMELTGIVYTEEEGTPTCTSRPTHECMLS